MPKLLDYYHKMLRGEVPHSPQAKLIGFNYTSIDYGKAEIEFESTQQHMNLVGILAGGVLSTIVDAVMGSAFATTLDDGEIPVTLELKINFLRSVRDGKLRGVAKVINRTRTTGFVECDVLDANQALVARATSTCMVVRPD
jgi:uncharacterized protein (TIGR00369 family)